MSDTRTEDAIRAIERRLTAVESETARLPVRIVGGGGGGSVKCYQIERCSDGFVRFISNAECKDHLEGGSEEAQPVAVIADDDGNLESWELTGEAPECKAAECVFIFWWLPSCPEEAACWRLARCGEGDDLIVRSDSWAWYSGLILKIDGVCYTVTPETDCADAVDMESPLTEDLVGPYPSCEACNKCYELTNCDDEGDVLNVINDLVTELGTFSPLGSIVRTRSGCYEVTAEVSPCVGSETYVDILASYPSCAACVCILLTPCDEESEEPLLTTRKVLDPDGDPIEVEEGDVFRMSDGVCRVASLTTSCETATTSASVVEQYDAGCECCKLTKWERCDSPDTFITTYSDLCQYLTSSYAIKRLEDGFCYHYDSTVLEEDWDGETEVEFTPDGIFKNEGGDPCDKCASPRYRLTPCDACGTCGSSGDPPDDILTDNPDLQPFIGQFVKVGAACYTAAEDDSEDEAASVDFSGPYATCEGCAAASSCIEVVSGVSCVDGELQVTYKTLKGVFIDCGSRQVPPEE